MENEILQNFQGIKINLHSAHIGTSIFRRFVYRRKDQFPAYSHIQTVYKVENEFLPSLGMKSE